MIVQRVTVRNARFQEWQALLTNRAKRQRSGEFVVQGVRPITLAVRLGWEVRELLFDERRDLSPWARDLLDTTTAPVAVAPELLRELGEKSGAAPELLAVVGMPTDDLGRIPASARLLVVVLDRPNSPGNIGTVVRSADAFGASGVVVTGHAADPYDPKAVRASTGSLFAVPVTRVGSHAEVLAWAAALEPPVQIVGTDEAGPTVAAEEDLTRPTLLVIGNETVGLSAAWREACDRLTRIPMVGTASSLNAAAAASVLLYEAARQRS